MKNIFPHTTEMFALGYESKYIENGDDTESEKQSKISLDSYQLIPNMFNTNIDDMLWFNIICGKMRPINGNKSQGKLDALYNKL